MLKQTELYHPKTFKYLAQRDQEASLPTKPIINRLLSEIIKNFICNF